MCLMWGQTRVALCKLVCLKHVCIITCIWSVLWISVAGIKGVLQHPEHPCFLRQCLCSFYQFLHVQNIVGSTLVYIIMLHVHIHTYMCFLRYGELDVVKWLVENGKSDISVRNSDGDTVLHDACRSVTVESLNTQGCQEISIAPNN